MRAVREELGTQTAADEENVANVVYSVLHFLVR